MRAFFMALLSTASLAIGAGVALGQSYPSKPIRAIIPAAPGGMVDTIGRAIGQHLADALGQSVVADNRPGAGTMIGSALTAKAPADGYTILWVTNSHAINAGLHKQLQYDPVTDFSEITLIATVPYMVIVHPSVPAKSVKELIALARQRPGQLHYASAGSGSSTHLAGELFRSMAGVDIVHVPYKGGTPGLMDVVGGHAEMMFNSIVSSLPLMKSRRIRAIAMTGAKRLANLPDIPTVAESGVPGYEASAWYGALAPAKTPREVIVTLNREIVRIVRTTDVKDKLLAVGAAPIGSTPEEFAAVMRNEIQKWSKVITKLGLKM
ncbi:MAG: tripartite tricarboxylate transporter substrate binding protein [Betaproteobacteria bacterium]|nr:tripartite tricarboxylate transporter substrate binding protein [Betaproteobacteria bacterium]